MTWVPRSSSLGAYYLCLYRAALDRLIAVGALDKPEPEESKGYMEHGTVCHWLTQQSLECAFPAGAEPPTDEEYTTAAAMFGGERNIQMAIADAVADLAAKSIREIDPLLKWQAETKWSTGQLTGHIDFITPDYDRIIDLKTTQRVPDHNRIKPGHLIQLLAYYILSGERATKGYVLYVDSLAAKWALLCPFDFTSPGVRELLGHVKGVIAAVNDPAKLKAAHPVIGAHCSSEFCPHRARCKDVFLPAPGLMLKDERRTAVKMPAITKF